jgi:hypothetical protein
MTGRVSRNVLDVELANGKPNDERPAMKLTINVSRHIKAYVDRPVDTKQWQDKVKLMSAWNNDVKELATVPVYRRYPRWLYK